MRIFFISAIVVFINLTSQVAAIASSDHAPKIAKRTEKLISLLSPRDVKSREVEVHVDGASFIKLHFRSFRLPSGMELEISNPEGTESYRYSKDKKGPFTFDRSAGDDGKNSFSAMSITGDTAIVRIIGKAPKGRGFEKSRKQQVLIDYFIEGLPSGFLEIDTPQTESGTSRLKTRSYIESSGSGGAHHIEYSCGEDEKFDTVCWAETNPTEYSASLPVAKLIVGLKTCTAWRAGPDNRLFTNNHCMLNKNEASNAEVWFNYENSVCGGTETEKVVKVSVDQLLSTDYTLDYSLFSVNDFSSIEMFGNLGIETRDVIQGERIYLPQHSNGLPKQLAIESDMDLDGLCHIENNDLNGRDVGTDVGYYCDTAGGSSGSPVLSGDSNKVIALNHSTSAPCLNSGVKMSLIWKKVSRFFGRVPPEGDVGNPPSPNPNTNPVANFSYACDQLSCSFNSGSSSDSDGSIVAYNWDFGDSNTGSGMNINHVFSAEGTYNVILTVQDNDGGTDTKSSTLQLGTVVLPPPAITLSGTANKLKGNKHADLNWSGAEASMVEIYRNDLLLAITENDGQFTDFDLAKRIKTVTYKVCDQGQIDCSNEIILTF